MQLSSHPEKISSHIKRLISLENGNGPITRQFVYQAEEEEKNTKDLADPIGDQDHEIQPGLIHRYKDRALLLPTSHCASHCRFCFRRERPHKSASADARNLKNNLAYIQNHPEIREVIVSGGDPLTLPAKTLKNLITALDKIQHLQFLRIHTRMPVVAPNMLNHARLNALKSKNKPLWMVLHINHASEITKDMQKTCRKLVGLGIPLLGQTVLLHKVNDDPDILAELFRTMAANQIKPYYLHHPDLVMGTRHFRVSLKDGQKIHAALRGHLSGFCIPDYILDLPGGYGKISIAKNGIVNLTDDDKAILCDRFGHHHAYP